MEQTIQNYNSIFWKLIKRYDLSESNLLRKVIHSFDVAQNCFTIACNKKLKENDRNLCYLMGLLHDIGRFEQWTKYKTYDDNKSVDHGEISHNILSKMDYQGYFNLSEKEFYTIKEAIRFHTKPYLGKDKNVIKFNNILLDGDAFANVISTANGMQQMTSSSNGVSDEILNDFIHKKFLKAYSPQTKLDRCLMLTACCYYVKNKFIRKIILDANYIEAIYERFSKYLTNADKTTYRKAIDNLLTNYI